MKASGSNGRAFHATVTKPRPHWNTLVKISLPKWKRNLVASSERRSIHGSGNPRAGPHGQARPLRQRGQETSRTGRGGVPGLRRERLFGIVHPADNGGRGHQPYRTS